MKTLYVIGAGASQEANMPCKDFNQKIEALCDADISLYRGKSRFDNELSKLISYYLREKKNSNQDQEKNLTGD